MATVTISQGALRGGICKTESGFQYHEFLGIPYAKPPVGELRFKNPQPAEKWENERDATSVPEQNIATQIDFVTGKIIGSEDCLYLNVFTPNLNSRLPVIVHIHGGGFIHGNGTIKSENGPDHLVEENVVVVTINYRLNVFGFLSLEIQEATGNMGLKDQLTAIKWVKNNISNFGGDENNITLMGISAGAASVEYLMLSPLANGLFHKAILRSGSALNHWAINYDIVELTIKLAQTLGYKGAIQDRKAVYEFLMNIPETTLIGASFQITETNVSNRVYFGFVPSVEKNYGNDEILTTDPYKLFEEGKFNKIPIIRGFCNREGSLMSMMKPNAMKTLIEKKNFMYHLSHTIESDESDKYNKRFSESYLYRSKPNADANQFAENFFTDYDFAAGIIIANKLSVNTDVPVYLYKFSYGGKLNMFKTMYGLMKTGAIHFDDFTYVFRHDLVKSDSKKDLEVRTALTGMVANFARTGNPTPNQDTRSINWPAYTTVSPTHLNIDAEFTIESEYEPDKIGIFENIIAKFKRL